MVIGAQLHFHQYMTCMKIDQRQSIHLFILVPATFTESVAIRNLPCQILLQPILKCFHLICFISSDREGKLNMTASVSCYASSTRSVWGKSWVLILSPDLLKNIYIYYYYYYYYSFSYFGELHQVTCEGNFHFHLVSNKIYSFLFHLHCRVVSYWKCFIVFIYIYIYIYIDS